jgi:parallel beta-helix repeat protein
MTSTTVFSAVQTSNADPFIEAVPDEEMTEDKLGALDQLLMTNTPLLLYFYVVDCEWCQKQESIVNQLKEEYAGLVHFLDVDGMTSPLMAELFEVSLYPSLVLIEKKTLDGYDYEIFHGFTGKNKVMRFLDSVLGIERSEYDDEQQSQSGGSSSSSQYIVDDRLISVHDVYGMMSSSDQVVFLDVRSTHQYASGHIDGSVSMPMDELACESCLLSQLGRYKDDMIIVYCDDGSLSLRAASLLHQNGFTEVYSLAGGLNAWKSEGLTVIEEITDAVDVPLLGLEVDALLEEKSVFLLFYADWCHYSQQQLSIVDDLEQDYAGQFAFLRINGDDYPSYVEEFKVQAFPTIMIITGKTSDGYKQETLIGFSEKTTLLSLMDPSDEPVKHFEESLPISEITDDTLMPGDEESQNQIQDGSKSRSTSVDPLSQYPQQDGQIIQSPSMKVSDEEAALLTDLHNAKQMGDRKKAHEIEEDLAVLHNIPLECVDSAGIDEDLEFHAGPVTESSGLAGSTWTDGDIMVAGTNETELEPSIVSAKDGTMYIALEHGGPGNEMIRIYKSTNNGQSWYYWYWLTGAGHVKQPSIAIGEATSNNWLFVAFKQGTQYIRVFRIDLDNTSFWEAITVENNVLGVANPKIVTDTAEYSYWYAYVIYNTRGVDNWVIEHSRSTDSGASWSSPAIIAGYCGYPDDFYNASNAHPDIDFGGGRLYVAFDNYQSACTVMRRDIYIMNSTNYGSSWNPAVQLTSNDDDEFGPTIAAAKHDFIDRTIVVAYTRYKSADYNYDVYYAYTKNGGRYWTTNWYMTYTTDDNEKTPDLATSYEKGAIHLAYWHDYDIDYRIADYRHPEHMYYSTSLVTSINENNWVSSVYSRPTIAANPNMPTSEEAAIAWTDYRGISYDIYFDSPTYGFCYNYDLNYWFIPSSTSDWSVFDRVECNHTQILLNGDLNIYGNLSFNDVLLQMNASYDGQYSIEVYSGGSFYINELPSGPSNITNGVNTSAHYTFYVNDGSIFDMRNSELHYVGFDWKEWPNKDAGLWINTDDAILISNTISHNYYAGVIIYNADYPYLSDNIIYSNRWYGIILQNSDYGDVISNTVTSTIDGIRVINSNDPDIWYNGVSSGDDGIYLSNSPSSYLYGNEVHCDDAIQLVDSPYARVFYNNVSGNTDGIVMSNCEMSTLWLNIANSNSNNGIYLEASPQCLITENTANGNGHGIVVYSSLMTNITENVANGNGDDGIYVSSSPESWILRNTADNNNNPVDIGTGLVVLFSPQTLIDDNQLNTNWRGLYLGQSDHCTIANTAADGNTWYGLHLYQSPDNDLVSNTVSFTTGEWDSAGIYLSESPNNVFTNNDCSHNYYGMVLWYSDTADIQENIANDNTRQGISLRQSGSSKIIKNEAVQNDVGISLQGSHFVEVYKNIADHNDIGISLYGSNSGEIISNIVTDSSSAGIYLSGSSEQTISYNDADDSRYGISLTSSSSDNDVNNNSADNANFGIAVQWNSNNNHVKDNHAISSIDRGVYLFRAHYNTFEDNDFRDTKSIGMSMERSDHNGVSNNDFSSLSKNYGIDLYESDMNMLHENNVENSGIGISLRFSDNNEVINNHADSNDISISVLQGDSNEFIGNDCSMNTNNGIEMSLSQSNMIHGNMVTSNPHYGIHLHSSTDNSLQGNTVTYNGVGVHLDWSSENTIKENDISINDFTGLALYWSSDFNQVFNNTGNGNGNVSVRVSSSKNNSIHHNIFNDNKLGVYLDWSTGNHINANQAVANLYHGISLDWLSNNNEVIENIATDNLIGIALSWSNTNLIQDNIANDNTMSILLEWSSSDNIVINNQANDNQDYGISLFWKSNNNMIESNTANNNRIGLYFDANSTGNTVFGNTFCNNMDWDIQDEDTNTGDDNNCTWTDNWDDTGTIGCTYTCSCLNLAPYPPSSPMPAHLETDVDVFSELSWIGGDPNSHDTVTYDVYFGTTNPPPKVTSNQSITSYDPGKMLVDTTYYWNIVSWDQHGETTSGPQWQFTTEVSGATAIMGITPAMKTVGLGEEFSLTVYIDPDEPVGGWKITLLTFTQGKVNATTVIPGPDWTNHFDNGTIDNDAGTITNIQTFTNLTLPSTNHTACTITFQAVESGLCQIILSDAQVHNASLDEMMTHTQHATVTITEAPIISNEYPVDGSTGVERPPLELRATVEDPNGDPMDIMIRWRQHDYFHQGEWLDLTSFTSVGNVTYNVNPAGSNWIWGNTTYTWSVNVTDGTYWVNKTFTFTMGGSRYDVNNDKKVNFIDAGIVWVHRSTNAVYDGLYDVNQDGNVNFVDAGKTWVNRD